MANAVFHALPATEFASSYELGCVKIAWTPRADLIGPMISVFRTQTRVTTTDPVARERFRSLPLLE